MFTVYIAEHSFFPHTVRFECYLNLLFLVIYPTVKYSSTMSIHCVVISPCDEYLHAGLVV